MANLIANPIPYKIPYKSQIQSYKSNVSITEQLTARAFSAHYLVAIPLLYAVKDIQARKFFLIIP